MPTREDMLREETFKGEFATMADEVERRVSHTLRGHRASQVPKTVQVDLPATEFASRLHRSEKLLGLLLAKAVRGGVITQDELDELLLSTVAEGP